MTKGKLIVIEGACDGIGKSTQFQLLNEQLKHVDAFCSKLNNDNIDCSNEFYKNNCLIFISLSGDSIKDSL
jgi:deoxyadenosine/deoxycytidine kinase